MRLVHTLVRLCHTFDLGNELTRGADLSGHLQCVPTNREISREDANDVVFRNSKGKWKAVQTEIERMHKQGRPILVGTTSVETSELVSSLLIDAGITHEARRPLLQPACRRRGDALESATKHR